MQFSKADLAWNAGFMLGTSAVYTLLGAAGLEERWPKLIVAVLCGVGIGWGLQRVLTTPKS